MTRKRFFAGLALGLLLLIPSVGYAEGMVRITSPANGATLDAMDESKLVYEVKPGPRGGLSIFMSTTRKWQYCVS